MSIRMSPCAKTQMTPAPHRAIRLRPFLPHIQDNIIESPTQLLCCIIEHYGTTRAPWRGNNACLVDLLSIRLRSALFHNASQLRQRSMKNTCGAGSCVQILLHPTTSNPTVAALPPLPPFRPVGKPGCPSPSNLLAQPVLHSLWRPLLALGLRQTHQAEEGDYYHCYFNWGNLGNDTRQKTAAERETEGRAPTPCPLARSNFLHSLSPSATLVFIFTTFIVCLPH